MTGASVGGDAAQGEKEQTGEAFRRQAGFSRRDGKIGMSGVRRPGPMGTVCGVRGTVQHLMGHKPHHLQLILDCGTAPNLCWGSGHKWQSLPGDLLIKEY